MSFEDDLLLQLRADLAQLLALPAEAIKVGRDPQKVTRQGIEVWIRPTGSEQLGPVRLHRYELHVRLQARREGDQTGSAQLGPVVRAIDAIRNRYDGARPFARAIPALVATEVEDQRFDPDAGDKDLLDALVTLKVGER